MMLPDSCFWRVAQRLLPALLILAVTQHLTMAAEPVRMNVGKDVGGWTLHESTGRVFASIISEGVVVEYDSESGEVRRFDVGAEPQSLICKGDRLVVACTKSTGLYVIDLKTNRSVGAVLLEGTGPYALFCSEVENGYVNCICKTGDAWWDGEVFQVDLKAMTVRKRQSLRGWGQSHAIHVAMSRDGKWIVPDARGASSPSGADLMKVDEDKLEFTQVRDYHSSFGQIVAGPMNRFWTFGNALYSLDITKKLRTFTGPHMAIHPDLNLAVSVTATGLVLERFNDASGIGVVPLEMAIAQSKTATLRGRSRSIQSADPTIGFDRKRNQVFVGRGRQAAWVNLNEFAGKLDPLRVIQVASEVSTLVGEELRVPVRVLDDGETEIALKLAPEGATLDNGELRWTPLASDVGTNQVRIELTSAADDSVLDTVEIQIRVMLPQVLLGFTAKTMAVSPDGRFVLVWGPSPGQESRHPAHAGPDNCVLVDLEKNEIVAKQAFLQGIRCAAVNDSFVYVAPHSGNLFVKLDHNLEQKARQFVSSAPKEMVTMAGGKLVIVSDQTHVYDGEKLEIDTELIGPPAIARLNSIVQTVSDELVQVGCRIINRRTGETVRLVNSTLLPSIAGTFQNFSRHRSGQAAVPRGWGRQITGQSLTNYRGSQIAQWAGISSSVIPTRWPVGITIRNVSSNTVGGVSAKTTLDLCSLVDGSIRHSLVIDVSVTRGSSRPPSFYGMRSLLTTVGDRVVYLGNDRLLLAKIPDSVLKNLPTPAHFRQDQQLELEVADSIEVPLRAGGIADGARFSLLAEYPGIAVNTDTGILTLKLEMLWKEFVDRAVSQQGVNFARDLRTGEVSPFNIEENGLRYQVLTGKKLKPGRLAAMLSISAALRDKEGQEDAVSFNVIVVGSRATFDAAVEERKRLQAKQLAASDKAMLEKAREQKQTADLPAIEKRLNDLESRIRRIEAALDAVLRKLEEKK
jgi:hypothetical protein